MKIKKADYKHLVLIQPSFKALKLEQAYEVVCTKMWRYTGSYRRTGNSADLALFRQALVKILTGFY